MSFMAMYPLAIMLVILIAAACLYILGRTEMEEKRPRWKTWLILVVMLLWSAVVFMRHSYVWYGNPTISSSDNQTSAVGASDDTEETSSAEVSDDAEDAGSANLLEEYLGQETRTYDGVEMTNIGLTSEEYVIAATDTGLLAEVNDFINMIYSESVMEHICDEYFGDGEPRGILPEEIQGSDGTLVVGTSLDYEPFAYDQGDDAYYGIDMEIAGLLAEYLDKDLEIQVMDYDGLFLSLAGGECDLVLSAISSDKDPGEGIYFSDPYYDASQRLLVREGDTAFDSYTGSPLDRLAELDYLVLVGVQSPAQLHMQEELEEHGCEYGVYGGYGLDLLQEGEGDCVIMDTTPAMFMTGTT